MYGPILYDMSYIGIDVGVLITENRARALYPKTKEGPSDVRPGPYNWGKTVRMY